MARLNVLTGEAIATVEAPAPKARKGKKAKASNVRASKVSTLPAIIAAFPQSMFSMLTNNPLDAEPSRAEAIRDGFAQYALAHPGAKNWRTAFDSFWHIQQTGGTGEVTRITPRLDPLLTRSFPKTLRRIIEARGDTVTFDAALKGRALFSRKYEHEGYLALSIEVLPMHRCPSRVPAVCVSHTYYIPQPGGEKLVRDPEILFAVIELEAWLPYEITQDSIGIERNAYADGGLDSRIAADIRPHAGAWALNLAKMGWCDAPKPPRAGIGPSVGSLIEAKLAAKVIPFPKPKAAPKNPALAKALAALNSVTMPGR
jgi:hypothetical protein